MSGIIKSMWDVLRLSDNIARCCLSQMVSVVSQGLMKKNGVIIVAATRGRHSRLQIQHIWSQELMVSILLSSCWANTECAVCESSFVVSQTVLVVSFSLKTSKHVCVHLSRSIHEKRKKSKNVEMCNWIWQNTFNSEWKQWDNGNIDSALFNFNCIVPVHVRSCLMNIPTWASTAQQWWGKTSF